MSQKQKARHNPYEKYSHICLNAIATAFFIGITAIYPLYITRFGYIFITKQKTEAFMAFTAIASVAVLFSLFFTTKKFQIKNYFAKNEPKRPISIPEWALIIFILLTLASAIFSPWQDFVWKGFTTNWLQGRWEGFWAFLCYALTFFIISRFYRPKRLHFLIFSAGSILVTLYGVIQFLGFDILVFSGFFLLSEDFEPITRIFRTTIGNINIVSGYCSLVIVLFASLFAGEESRWGLLYLFASIMAFIMLMISQGDSAKIGVLVGMVLLIPYWLSDRNRLGKILIALSGWSVAYSVYHGYVSVFKHRFEAAPAFAADLDYFLWVYTPPNLTVFISIAVVLLVAGLILILVIKKWPQRPLKITGVIFLALSIAGGLLFVEVFGSRIENQPNNVIFQAREIMRGRMEDRFGSYRGWIWKNGMSVVLDNPLLGTGPDTFFFALGGQQISAVPTEENPLPIIIEPAGRQLEYVEVNKVIVDKAHNTFLQIAVCMGIPALLAYLVFIGGMFSASIKKAFDRPILLAFGAAALSYLIQSFFQIDTPIDRPLIYVALGVMAGELWKEKIAAASMDNKM